MPDLEKLLMPHQLEVIERLDNGKILYGSTGDGKTHAAAGYYVAKELPVAKRDIYVITTAKKRDSLDWEATFAHFGIGNMEESSLGGILTVDSWANLPKYTSIQDAFFIFDEQRLVGKGAWVKAFLKLAKNNRWIMLSGTPGDTWMDYIPVFVANGYFKNRTEFLRQHVVYEWQRYGKYPMIKGYLNEFKLECLRNELLVEMPFEKHTKRHMHWITVEYDEIWAKKVRKDRWHIYENRPIKDASEKWRLLRRIANQDPSRIESVRSLLAVHPRLIVWYTYDYELNILLDLGGEVPTYQYNGHRHDPVPQGDKWVYLVQYQAGAEAWNCVDTDAMVLYSLPDSYKLYQQCLGRIDRLNTPFVDLHYYLLVSNLSIDVKKRKSLENKEDFNERKFVQMMELVDQK